MPQPLSEQARSPRFPPVATILACAFLAAAVASAPGAAAAGKVTSCGSKTIAASDGGKTVKVPVSLIKVEGGATCAEAATVIRGVVLHKVPTGWRVAEGNFKVPHGLNAEVAVNGKKRVTFALVGS